MTLPRFSDLQGIYYTLPALPPCHFTGMNTQLFPLRANLDTLQQFCNRYANIMPHRLGWFRAFMPFVYFGVIDYGKMASTGANTGWLSQHEVIFSIPVEWYREEAGELVFQDWCWITPFIFVDSETSLTLGRTVWGWPKSLIRVVPNQAAVLGSPTGNSPLLRLAASVFPRDYAGRKQEMRIFLEVNREPGPSPVRFPPATDNPFLPWNIASNLFGSAVGFLDDLMNTATGLTRAPPGASLYPGNLGNMLRRGFDRIDPRGQNMYFNTVCLKQFRHSGSPVNYCYQAMTIAQMQVTSFNQGGILGDTQIMLGDESGGYSIDLWTWPSLPIVETLGLDVAERRRDGEVECVRLRPVLPIWYDVNMIYNLGYNMGWRSFDRTWHDAAGQTYPPLRGYEDPNEALFNTATGAAGQAVAGPFYFPSATLRVLPLLARRAALESFLARYLNVPLHTAGQRFRLWAPSDTEFAYVYMVAIHYGPMASESNDIGSWANNSLMFMIPIIHEERQNDEWVIRDVGMVPAYTYVDSTTAAITNSEVFGIPTTHGQFLSPPSVWMTPDGLPPAPLQPLLSVAVELLPALDEGQRVVTRVITEILQTVSTEQPAQPQDAAREEFCRALSDELTRKYETKSAHSSDMKNARTLALKLLADGSSIKQYTLKQFRDVTRPELACYQSLTCIERTFNEVFLIKEMELPLRVQIHEYPTQPLVKLLGLVYQERRVGDGSMVYTLEPLRPFWIHATMTESLGTRILFRAGDSTWHKYVLDPHPGAADAAPISASLLKQRAKLHYSKALDALLNDVPPLRLQSLLLPFRGPAPAPDAISTQQGLHAALHIDPQMVIESVLSREWEDRTPQARWHQRQERMARELDETMKAALPSHRSAVRRRYILKQLKHAQSRPFQPDVHGEVLVLLDRLDELAALTSQIEASCEAYRGLLDAARAPSARAWQRHDKTLHQHCAALRDYLQRYRDRYMEQIGHRLDYLENTWNAAEERARPAPATQADREEMLIRRSHQRELTLQLLGLLLSEQDRLHAATLDKLAKAWQKPDFCVRRDIAGGDRDRLFPRELSWADQWYVGWREP